MRNDTNWLRLLVGLGLVYAIFHGTATALGSDRGQAGILVGGIVVAATLAVERSFFRTPLATAIQAVGFRRPRALGLLAAAALSAVLLLVFPVFAAVTGTSFGLYPRWAWLLPGLFAQAGIAEEVLFRGYLFGRIRVGRSFWRAVALAAVPFVVVHLVMFLTMPWPIAVAAILLAAVISAPLAYLYELGGGTVWAPAVVHFVVQGAIKVIVPTSSTTLLPLVWMAASAALPYLVFLIPRRSRDR